MKIELPSFILEKINITNSKHLQVIKEFDRDYIVKKYLYPYKDSFYDLVSNDLNSPTVFNTFYIIYLKENKDYVTKFYDIGDGLSVSFKRNEKRKDTN